MSKKLIPLIAVLLSPVAMFSSNQVEIAISQTGVYGIPYSQLREMGFTSPEKVGVSGQGGQALSLSNNGIEKTKKTIIPVIHQNSTLFFYGIGVEEISSSEFEQTPDGIRYTKISENNNSHYGYYTLSDSDDAILSFEKATISNSSSNLDWGVTFFKHEQNLFNNTTNTGNLYWGESFSQTNPRIDWEIDLPDAIDGRGFFDFVFYSEPNVVISCEFGTNQPNGVKSLGEIKSTTSYYKPLDLTYLTLPVKKGTNTLFIECKSEEKRATANLDYWILSYRSDFSSVAAKGYAHLAFPQLLTGNYATINASLSQDIVALDITSKDDIKELSRNSDNKFIVSRNKKIPEVIFFDTQKSQRQISSWKKLDNNTRNLHDLAKSGADFIIISTEQLIPYAEKIAELHRINDGLDVIVTDISTVYQEFSEGLPDPEAYRRLVAFASTIRPVSNLLLMGPVRGDALKAEKFLGRNQFHILKQSSEIDAEAGAFPLGDYYGITSDSFNPQRIERETLGCGIGYLPFISEQEAAMYVDKLEDYMTSSNKVYTLNEWLFMGGTGDNHTHDIQCVDLASFLEEESENSAIPSVLALDSYGIKEAHDKLLEYIDGGKTFISYIGHGGNSEFGKSQNGDFFGASDIATLRNNYLPFLFTAACVTGQFDLGLRGIGEEFVLGSKRGGIGSMCTMRDVWSGQNFDMLNKFISRVTSTGAGLTIGEIIRDVKNNIFTTNKLPYSLVCDPALKIPMPVPQVTVNAPSSIVPGNEIEISGSVITDNGSIDSGFSGKAVLKIFEPARTITAPDFETGNSNSKTLEVKYMDNLVAMTETDVTNGRFTTKLTVPYSLSSFKGENCMIYASCLDVDAGRGATGSFKTSIGASTSQSTPTDNQPPVIESMTFDPQSDLLTVEVSDNYGINFAGNSHSRSMIVKSDGAVNKSTSLAPQSIYEGGKKAVLFASLNTLSPGMHTISVDISDINGNVASKEIIINNGTDLQTISLTLKEDAIHDIATFEIEGVSRPAEIRIFNSSGKWINSVPVENHRAVWNRLDSEGNTSSSGIYKAVAVEKPTNGEAGHYSQTIIIPVI